MVGFQVKLKDFSTAQQRIVHIGLLVSLICSWSLWYPNDRLDFPLIPLIGTAFDYGDHHIHSILGWITIITLILASLWSVYAAMQKTTPIIVLICLCLLSAQDSTRFQPWIWFFAIVIIFFILSRKTEPNTRQYLLLVLISTLYFWSGFHKLNPFFAHDGFEWFCSASKTTEWIGQYSLLGYAVAFAEMLLLPGLLWAKARPYFRYVVVLFHLVVSVMLWRADWNLIVIPWNLSMAALIWLATIPDNSKVKIDRKSKAWIWVFALFFLPVFSTFHLAPKVFGWYLYDDTQPEYTFDCGKHKPNQLPSTSHISEIWSQYAYDDHSKLLLDDWTMAAFGVPMPYNDNYAQKLANYLCRTYVNGSLMILKVNPYRYDSENITNTSCQ